MKMTKQLSDPKIRTLALTVVYVLIMMIPNIVLACTEPYAPWSKAVSVTMPLGFYLLWSVLVRRSGITIWGSFPFIFFGAFQIVLLYLFGNSIIATDMFLNLMTTNPNEAGEVLGNIWPAILIVAAIYVPLLWLASLEIRNRRIIPQKLRLAFGVSGVALLLFSLAALTPAKHEMQPERNHAGESAIKSVVFPVNVFYNLKLSISEHRKMNAFERTSEGFRYEAVRTDSAPLREIYVYVIGEASRADRWQLYGCERETNPELSQCRELVLYRNMLTQSNTTHKSVPLILSSVATEEHEQLFVRKGLPACFNEAGFDTWFLSNQAPQNAMVDKLAADARHRIYLEDAHLDMQLLDAMNEAIETTEGNLLVVLHCYGSHYSYRQRYPREFARWQPDADVAITRRNIEDLRNAYDNSVLYTDHFLKALIASLEKHPECCSALLYCADHGEDLLDDDRGRFLHASPTVSYYQLHVAALAWFSPAYEEHFPGKTAAARRNVWAPATTHALFHTMTDMASIATPYLDRGVSLVSDSFDTERPRRYLDDHNMAESYERMGLTKEDMAHFRAAGITSL